MQDDGDRWITNMDEIKGFFLSKYTKLFLGPTLDPHPCMGELFPKAISEEENFELLKIPTEMKSTES